ncbi:MAG: SCO family protein [Pseudomonadota bacterium]|nr:SCO family protein [Pseudomonadota bacterium]
MHLPLPTLPRRFAVRAACHRALLLLCLGVAGLAGAAGPLPSDSIYHLDLPLHDQDGRAFTLASGQGRPQLVSMFYTSCQFVCPRLIDTVRDVQRALPADSARQLHVLLVTLDPARDDSAALRGVAAQRHLDARTWTLARSDSAGTRALAALLGVQYRILPSGDINHSTVLILLDRQGRVVAQSTRLGVPDPAFVARVASTVAAAD